MVPIRGSKGRGSRGPWALWALCALWMTLVGCDRPEHPVASWSLSGTPPQAVQLPAHLDVGDRDQTYVLTTRYALPARLAGRELDFVIPHLWANTELWVDGARAVRLVERPSGRERTTTPHLYRIPASASADGVLALALYVEHRWTQSAWLDVVPRLTRASETDPAAFWAALFNGPFSLFAIATLLQIGLAALLVYFIGGRRRVYLYFGIQAVAAAVYPMFVVGSTQPLFGHQLEVVFTAGGLIVAVWVSAYFSYAFFALGPVPRWVDVLHAAALLLTVAGHDPYLSTRTGGTAAIGIVGLAVVLQSTLCLRMTLVPERRLEARWYLACWLALAATCWNEMVTWGGLGDAFSGPRAACAGLMAFAFFLSLLLSQRHMIALGQSDRLNTELEARVSDLERRGEEIAELNAELRRQIAERSEQIYAALALRDRPDARAPSLSVGELVQNRYRTVSLRGMGGMGSVYEVERVRDGLHFALKLTRESSGFALARLAREAQIAAQLAHPNVVRVVDVDIASTLGVLYIVMELVDGKPVSELAENYGNRRWALTVLGQVAAGLGVLHEAGIIHRDIKPPNILVVDAHDVASLCVKITDFGIAKLDALESIAPPAAMSGEPTVPMRAPRSDDDGATELLSSGATTVERQSTHGSFTRAGVIPGTPSYMAPELMRPNNTATSAADMYSFGIMAFELLTGARPFSRPQALSTLSGEEPEPAPTLREKGVELSPALSRALEACLSLSPEARPTASQLLALFSAH